MARKQTSSPNNRLWTLIAIVAFALVLYGTMAQGRSGGTGSNPSANDGVSVPTPSSDATPVFPTEVAEVNTTPEGVPGIATATRPVRGTAVPAPAVDTPPLPANLTEGEVTRVVDGDTIDVNVDGRTERVRMIGLNTPESVDSDRPVQCFGIEASSFTKDLLTNQTVLLESDPTQGDADQYDRLLRYVWLTDGRMVNLELIGGGYAAQYTFDNPYKYRDIFVAAERNARDMDAGLWAPMTCNGNFNAPLPQQPASGEGCIEGCVNHIAGCDIKGNVNARGNKIYHEPGVSDVYDDVNINVSEGDRWFCTADEAEVAGFVAAP